MMSCSGRRRGFTLLETLISLGLIGLLMAVVWSLLTMYARVEEQGNQRALALQLVRSLHTQLRRDLQAVVVADTRPTAQQSGNAAATPSLVGTTESLQVLISEDPVLAAQLPSSTGLLNVQTLAGQSGFENSRVAQSNQLSSSGSQVVSNSQGFPAGTGLATSPGGGGLSNALTADDGTGTAAMSSGAAASSGYFLVEYRFHAHPYLALTTGGVTSSSTNVTADLATQDLAAQGGSPSSSASGLMPPMDNSLGGASPEDMGLGTTAVASLSPTSQGLVRTATSWSPASGRGVVAGPGASTTENSAAGGTAVDGTAAGGTNSDGTPSGNLAGTSTFALQSEVPAVDSGAELGAPWAADSPTTAPIVLPPRQDAVPEITRCEFRYFDGTIWRESWQGTAEQPLPVAIEVAMDLESTGRHQELLDGQAQAVRLAATDPGAALSADAAQNSRGSTSEGRSASISSTGASQRSSLSDLPDTTSLLDSVVWVPQYRFVIRLDGSVSPAAQANSDLSGNTELMDGGSATGGGDSSTLGDQESLR